MKKIDQQNCDCCKKPININKLTSLKFDEIGKYSVCKKCSEKWDKYMVNETLIRLDNYGDTLNIDLIIEETKYLLSVVEDGGSWYNDEEEEEKKMIKECKQFLKIFGNMEKC